MNMDSLEAIIDDPLRLVVFDCDGTLVDSQHVIVAAMASACEAHGFERPADLAVRRSIGLPLAEAIASIMTEHGPEDHARLVAHFRDSFVASRAAQHHEPLFPGIVEALEAFDAAGYLLGVATGKPRRGLNVTLELHGLSSRFCTLKTADDGPGKPHPAILLAAIEEAGVEAEHCVMIGDTSFDMAMARAAGARAVGVAWGYHDADDLLQAGAHCVVETCEELVEVVHRLYRGAGQ